MGRAWKGSRVTCAGDGACFENFAARSKKPTARMIEVAFGCSNSWFLGVITTFLQ
jgi:hypothetical protein